MKFTSFFSTRVQKILEVYLKDVTQMSEEHEVYFIFSKRMQKIFGIYPKDAIQMSEKHEVYFIFFKANAENLRGLPKKHKNKNKKYIKLTNN